MESRVASMSVEAMIQTSIAFSAIFLVLSLDHFVGAGDA
jgi:hypothetical protein